MDNSLDFHATEILNKLSKSNHAIKNLMTDPFLINIPDQQSVNLLKTELACQFSLINTLTLMSFLISSPFKND